MSTEFNRKAMWFPIEVGTMCGLAESGSRLLPEGSDLEAVISSGEYFELTSTEAEASLRCVDDLSDPDHPLGRDMYAARGPGGVEVWDEAFELAWFHPDPAVHESLKDGIKLTELKALGFQMFKIM